MPDSLMIDTVVNSLRYVSMREFFAKSKFYGEYFYIDKKSDGLLYTVYDLVYKNRTIVSRRRGFSSLNKLKSYIKRAKFEVDYEEFDYN